MLEAFYILCVDSLEHSLLDMSHSVSIWIEFESFFFLIGDTNMIKGGGKDAGAHLKVISESSTLPAS